MERAGMTEHDLHRAKDPDLIGSVATMQRAAKAARTLAIQTNTSVVVVGRGKIVHRTAAELIKRERAKCVGK